MPEGTPAPDGYPGTQRPNRPVSRVAGCRDRVAPVAADLLEAVRSSSLGVLCWASATGPRCRGVVALDRHDRPALAFTYADAALAREVAGAPDVILALAEGRGTSPRFRAVLARGSARLVEDPTGVLFQRDLLEQELRRCPPARALADSPLLRREHWWFLPRLIVELEVRTVEPLSPLTAAHDHLLVVDGADGTEVQPAAVRERVSGSLLLDVTGAAAGPGRAALFGQDAAFPDLERWSQWTYTGAWDGGHLRVDHEPDRTGLEPVPGLLRRWRRQRALERRCREAIPAGPEPTG